MKLSKHKKAISLVNIILLVTLLIIIGWGYFGKYFNSINLGIFSNNKCEQAGKTADYYQSELDKTLTDAVLLSAKTDPDSQKLLAAKNQTILSLFKEYTDCYLTAYEENNFKGFSKNPLDSLSFNKNTLIYLADLLYNSNQKANARFYYAKYIKDYEKEDPVGADYALYMESRAYFDEGQYKLVYDDEHLGKLKDQDTSDKRYTKDDVRFYYYLAEFKQAVSEDSTSPTYQKNIDAATADLKTYYNTGTHKKEIEWQLATYYYSKSDYTEAQTYLTALVARGTPESLIAKSDLAYIPWAQSRDEKDKSKKINLLGDAIAQFLEYGDLVKKVNSNLPADQQLSWQNTQQDLMDLNICKLYEELGNNGGGLSGKTPQDSYCSAIKQCQKVKDIYDTKSVFYGDADSTITTSTKECDDYCDANKGKCAKKCSESGGCPP